MFFSDQRYTAEIDSDSPAVGHIAERRFAEFLRTFRSEDDAFIYRDQLLRNKNRLRIKLEHLRAFDDELGDLLVQKPAEYLALLEMAASTVLLSLQAATDEANWCTERVGLRTTQKNMLEDRLENGWEDEREYEENGGIDP